MEHMLKSFGTHHPKHSFSSTLPQTPETTKPVYDGLCRCSNMAEAMGFELMDLLQSTVFKTLYLSLFNNELTDNLFRISSFFLALEATSLKGLISKCGNDLPPPMASCRTKKTQSTSVARNDFRNIPLRFCREPESAITGFSSRIPDNGIRFKTCFSCAARKYVDFSDR